MACVLCLFSKVERQVLVSDFYYGLIVHQGPITGQLWQTGILTILTVAQLGTLSFEVNESPSPTMAPNSTEGCFQQLSLNGTLGEGVSKRKVGFKVVTNSPFEDFNSYRSKGCFTENLPLLPSCPPSQGSMELHLLPNKGYPGKVPRKSTMSSGIRGPRKEDAA